MNPLPDKPRLLLVDDDVELGRMLADFLAPEHISLAAAISGERGLEMLRDERFDLVILDIMMPGMSGLDVLQRLRPDNLVPVIMLTARGDDVDRIVGLEFGADDYLAKPFNPRELLARIRAILRRANARPEADSELRLGTIVLDPRSRSVAVDDATVQLTGTEFEILHCLMQTPGQVVSKERLSEVALGRRLLPYDRSIDTHISNLRNKLETAGGCEATIRNQRGVGYLAVPARDSKT